MLSARIRELRNQKDLLQKDVAAYLDISQQAVARWEKGQTEPDAETITKLAEYFNCTTDYLLGKSDTPTMDPDIKDAPLAFMGNTEGITLEELEKVINRAVKKALDEREREKD